MVLCVALSYVLDERTVVGQKVGGYVDRLCVPNLTVLQTELLGTQSRQEAQLRPDAEVRYNYVQGLVK